MIALKLLLLFLFLIHWRGTAAEDKADHGEDVESINNTLSQRMTSILNKLVDPNGPRKYDKRLRPNYGGQPVDVGITIHVSSISAVSEVEMDYTLDIYLRQSWTDPRLKFRNIDGDLTIGVEYMRDIWVPDTFFPNEKNSFFHHATTHNSFLRITKRGEVLTSQRLTVTATCPMNLHLFPLDSQECTLEIESYGYSKADIGYGWRLGNRSVTIAAMKLPQFAITGHRIDVVNIELVTGIYGRLVVTFLFERSLGFYLIQIYLPSILIVVISWVSFWLSRDATPARVALGVTTVLTMTTLMTTTNSSMPKVSYTKSLDIYLIACFLLIFASLIEYAIVGYMNKRIRMRKETKLQEGTTALGLGNMMMQSAPTSTNFKPQQRQMYPIVKNPAAQHYDEEHAHQSPRTSFAQKNKFRLYPRRPSSVSHDESGPNLYKDYLRRDDSSYYTSAPVAQQGHFEMPPCDCDWEYIQQKEQKGKKMLRFLPRRKKLINQRFRRNLRFTPSAIDQNSRWFFPLFFAIFNGLYWSIYYYLSSQEKLARLAQHEENEND